MTRTTYDADDGEIPKRTSSSIYLIHDSSKNSFYLKVMEAFARAEKKLKPRWQEMFEDVYDDVPPHLV